ncbi:hypothetical protein THIX_70228 [Thiomonas sp. X19]|uniref:hypothetical protein n=1 Tax=Thiomonas sp. X19 TaxID=1050370 RepID=UPI000B6FFFAB|nr:hypothetical protein [Thiomonas sp. X19]SCC95199.1 hypothetical protein THIX_70228 [Thiomonas sp. X19]
MMPTAADRLPVLTEVIDGWPDDVGPAPQQSMPPAAPTAPSIAPLAISGEASWQPAPASAPAAALFAQDAGLGELQGLLSAEAAAELVQAQLDAALPRLQEWLRVDLAQRLNRELELQIHALLDVRLSSLARELALELRPWVEDIAQDTMARVLAEGLGT